MTRRDFLRLSALSLGGLAFSSWSNGNLVNDSGQIARVIWGKWDASVNKFIVSVYKEPNEKSVIVCPQYQDDIIHIYEKVQSPEGPSYNPYWYRVWRGYIHSAHIQEIDVRLNSVLSTIPNNFQLGEVTVPYTQSLRYNQNDGWTSVYRLYYGSTHWIVDVTPGPDNRAWYVLQDELGGGKYLVDGEHIRPVTADELTPISPDIPADQKRIEVSLDKQILTAYEGSNIALQTKISSGEKSYYLTAGKISTETPKGTFHIENKMPSKHMGDGHETADPNDPNAYELPGVPWVSFFELTTGVAFHGTFWHNNFGVPMSHGCVNMRNDEAKWIFRWSNPVATSAQKERIGYGTQVFVY